MNLRVEVDSGEILYKYFRVINGEASWDNDEWEGDPNRRHHPYGRNQFIVITGVINL